MYIEENNVIAESENMEIIFLAMIHTPVIYKSLESRNTFVIKA